MVFVGLRWVFLLFGVVLMIEEANFSLFSGFIALESKELEKQSQQR